MEAPKNRKILKILDSPRNKGKALELFLRASLAENSGQSSFSLDYKDDFGKERVVEIGIKDFLKTTRL